MDEMISRAEAIEALQGILKRAKARPGTSVFEIMRIADCEDAIKGVPAVPVAHGKWVKVYGFATPGGDPVWRCSECGKGVHVYGIEHGSYGADVADSQWGCVPELWG